MVKTDTDKTSIALISKDIAYIQKDIADINLNIKGLTGVFASKEELAVVAAQTEKRLCYLENRANGLSRFTVPIVVAIASSVVTFLVISYLQSGKI
jgi:hypothetical protein